jgi:NhaP-type Na+/H+ or K+/H+ antiporter
VSANDILLGLGLVIVLAVGSQLLADRFRLPAIVLLLPAGFVAGAITDDVHPDALFGNAFQPIVSLGVGLILFEAGLRLRFDELGDGVRAVVARLIPIGVVIGGVGVSVAVKLLFGLDWGVSVVLGAVLVVSGPTVVLPLLAFVRPTDRVRAVLKWEGVLIDPIGALLGVLAFTAVRAGIGGEHAFAPGGLIGGIVVGLIAGGLGALLLMLLLRGTQRSSPRQGVPIALMVVTAALVAADLVRDDSGFVAATVMGMVMANQTRISVSEILEFQGTVVQLLIGILFVVISASVEPDTVTDLLPEGVALIAIMTLVLRPLAVVLGTARSSLDRAERTFMAWLAPRGIVAAATASAFGQQLVNAGIPGASQILPIAFIAIFGTVVLYGLTALPVARALKLAGAGTTVVLLVGGQIWVRAIARALKGAGLGVRLWTGRAGEQAAARAEGLTAGNARLGVDLTAREEELEEVTDALVLTPDDDFNALAAFELRKELGGDHVYRLAAGPELLDLVPKYAEGGVLFSTTLTHAELCRRFEAGAEIVSLPAPAEGHEPLFVVRGDGELAVVTATRPADPAPGDVVIALTPPRSPAAVVPDLYTAEVADDR